jgi:hypothetical protein
MTVLKKLWWLLVELFTGDPPSKPRNFRIWHT